MMGALPSPHADKTPADCISVTSPRRCGTSGVAPGGRRVFSCVSEGDGLRVFFLCHPIPECNRDLPKLTRYAARASFAVLVIADSLCPRRDAGRVHSPDPSDHLAWE